MSINILHLLWICPLCASFGVMILAVLVAGKDHND